MNHWQRSVASLLYEETFEEKIASGKNRGQEIKSHTLIPFDTIKPFLDDPGYVPAIKETLYVLGIDENTFDDKPKLFKILSDRSKVLFTSNQNSGSKITNIYINANTDKNPRDEYLNRISDPRKVFSDGGNYKRFKLGKADKLFEYLDLIKQVKAKAEEWNKVLLKDKETKGRWCEYVISPDVRSEFKKGSKNKFIRGIYLILHKNDGTESKREVMKTTSELRKFIASSTDNSYGLPHNKQATTSMEGSQINNLKKSMKNGSEKSAKYQDLNTGVLILNKENGTVKGEHRKSGKGGGTDFSETRTKGIDGTIRIPGKNGNKEQIIFMNMKNHKDVKNLRWEEISFLNMASDKRTEGNRIICVPSSSQKELLYYSILGQKSEINLPTFTKDSTEVPINDSIYVYPAYDKFWWNSSKSLRYTMDKYFTKQVLEPLSKTVGIMISEDKNQFDDSDSLEVIHFEEAGSNKISWITCLQDIKKTVRKMQSLGLFVGTVPLLIKQAEAKLQRKSERKVASTDTEYFPY